jgi:3-vinyl bacteriochlorophyllide hydratase
MHNLPGQTEPICPFESDRTRGPVVRGNLRRPSKSHSERLSRNLYAWAGLTSLVLPDFEAVGPPSRSLPRMLYTAEERCRRDASRWTVVQGVLAPLQFVIFLVSFFLVLSYLATGEGLIAATISIVAKTLILYVIMVTGSLWEHDVYGRYLFAPAFFWEDAVSMLVLALHTAYLGALATGWLSPRGQMFLALAAYVAYVVNATQFVLKLQAARRGQPSPTAPGFVECAQ